MRGISILATLLLGASAVPTSTRPIDLVPLPTSADKTDEAPKASVAMSDTNSIAARQYQVSFDAWQDVNFSGKRFHFTPISNQCYYYTDSWNNNIGSLQVSYTDSCVFYDSSDCSFNANAQAFIVNGNQAQPKDLRTYAVYGNLNWNDRISSYICYTGYL